MFRVLVLVCAVLCASVGRTAALPELFRGELYHRGRPLREVYTEALEAQEDQDDDDYALNHQFFTQRVDHFDRNNLDTFEQRYFVNDTFWKGPESGAPVFLCVGGEGPPLDWTVLYESDHCNDMVELAPQMGALMLALEHRYYGLSNPGKFFGTNNLRFLSSEQALDDIAEFHRWATEQYGLVSPLDDATNGNKWVSFGGSYPGMMSAFARLRYPNLFHASVSSSSPMQAQTDNYGYNDVVASSLAAHSVGGSQQCLDVVVEGHEQVGELLKTVDGQAELADEFNLCDANSLADPNNQVIWAGMGVVYIPSQSNDPSCTSPLCNIEKICDFLLDDKNGEESIDRLASLSAKQNANQCVRLDYNAVVDSYANPINPSRVWQYQTCSEWGFYQTCETGSKCPYTQGLHTLESFDYPVCQAAYEIDPDTINYNVDMANARYGGDQIQSSRILFPNGEVDPWHALGVLEPPNGDEPALWVEGASHHFWTHASEPTDSAEVVAARHVIWETVTAWLKMSP